MPQVFETLRGDASLAHWSVRASYVELYNEAFHDLLNPSAARPELRLDEFKCAAQGCAGLCFGGQSLRSALQRVAQNGQESGDSLWVGSSDEWIACWS